MISGLEVEKSGPPVPSTIDYCGTLTVYGQYAMAGRNGSEMRFRAGR
jgi:hypothetical protein